MNFMEAVEQMKQGKKVRRSHWKQYNGFALYDAEGTGLLFTNNRTSDKLTIEDIKATDWEVVDEESDWNLADSHPIPTEWEHVSAENRAYTTDKVKKCRDLILKDFREHISFRNSTILLTTTNIINNRFGDLK